MTSDISGMIAEASGIWQMWSQAWGGSRRIGQGHPPAGEQPTPCHPEVWVIEAAVVSPKASVHLWEEIVSRQPYFLLWQVTVWSVDQESGVEHRATGRSDLVLDSILGAEERSTWRR